MSSAWSLGLDVIVKSPAGSGLESFLNVAYPVGDIVIGTMLILALRRASDETQGRLLLPPVIRQGANLAGDVNVLGMQTVLEVVNAEMFEAQWKGPNGVVEMSRDSRAALAEKTKALKS